MVRSGFESAAARSHDRLERKFKEIGSRPESCKPLSEDDYTVLAMAKGINGLGWTNEDGEFDKNKMAESL